MTLPDQTTGEELRELIADYERRLKAVALTPRVPEVRLAGVRGGLLVETAGTLSRVRALSLLSEGARPGSGLPRVALTFQWPRIDRLGTYYVRTSPARLLRTGERWNEEAYGPPRTVHEVRVEAITDRVELVFESVFEELIIGTPTASNPGAAPREWLVPPSATAIAGEGRLVYYTGQEVEVRGAQLLLRVGGDFSLGIHTGGVYARFFSTEPALVRIGTAWLETQPARS